MMIPRTIVTTTITDLFSIGYRLLGIGYRLLAIGYRLLAMGIALSPPRPTIQSCQSQAYGRSALRCLLRMR